MKETNAPLYLTRLQIGTARRGRVSTRQCEHFSDKGERCRCKKLRVFRNPKETASECECFARS